MMNPEDEGPCADLPIPLEDWLLACEPGEEPEPPLLRPEAHRRVMSCLRLLAQLCEAAPDDPEVAALAAAPVSIAVFPDAEAFAQWEHRCHAAATRLL